MNARRMNLEGEEGWEGETGKVGMKRRRVPEGIEVMGRRGKGKGWEARGEERGGPLT